MTSEQASLRLYCLCVLWNLRLLTTWLHAVHFTSEIRCMHLSKHDPGFLIGYRGQSYRADRNVEGVKLGRHQV